jgi:hypothetical protein
MTVRPPEPGPPQQVAQPPPVRRGVELPYGQRIIGPLGGLGELGLRCGQLIACRAGVRQVLHGGAGRPLGGQAGRDLLRPVRSYRRAGLPPHAQRVQRCS